jgi:hypothetical protein
MNENQWRLQRRRQLRRLLLSTVASFLFCGTILVSSMWILAERAPFAPGDPLFFLQSGAEQLHIRISLIPEDRVTVLLSYLQRREADLLEKLGTDGEEAALHHFQEMLDDTMAAIAALPADLQGEYHQQVLRYVDQALLYLENHKNELSDTAIAFTGELRALQTSIGQDTDPIAVAAVVDMVELLPPTAVPEETHSPTRAADPLVLEEIVAVPFPEESVDHSFFPLTGGHALACETCHTSGDYQGTPATCYACHAVDDVHNGSYGQDCTLCHQVTVWETAVFNHAIIGATDCAACHAPPANHYAGACSACHTDTDNFRNAFFNHSTIGATDCAACHAPPANHYAGACSACHTDTDNFRNAFFNHSTIGATDCAACHAPPANHYAGACSACHTDTDNFRNAFFNHSTIGATDCNACHAPPANHYGGSCRACHTDTNNFRNATFNHSTIGATDCNACHAPPANHYGGSCRACHTDTNNFRNATFNHSTIGATDCNACHAPPANHYGGSCRACHTDTNNFRNATFNHSTIGATDCNACHTPPANHYAGSCRDCHTDTNNFRNATFNHSTIGATDCNACHTPPANHYAGSCRDCHTDTGNFRNAAFNHSFPINHNGANGDCATCHPGGNTSSYTCTNCHEHRESEVNEDHDEVAGFPAPCASCHPDGKD